MSQDGRLTRRLCGAIKARLPEIGLAQVNDPRGRRGRRWKLQTLLRVVVVGIMAGAKSLVDVEKLTAEMSGAARALLGLRRRIADTTLRDALCRLSIDKLRAALHRTIHAAHRRKALAPVDLPFGVVAMDGKWTAIDGIDTEYAQRNHRDDGGEYGLVRTVTCTLSSAAAKVCIDAAPIPVATNEMGFFKTALEKLLEAYGRIKLFRLVTYDAGACSEENARFVVDKGLDYLFTLTDAQPTLLAEAERVLSHIGALRADATTEDVKNGRIVVREIYITTEMAAYQWAHLKTVLRVRSRTTDKNGNNPVLDERYFAASLEKGALTAHQWLSVIRLHWAVENNCHHTFDTAFQEDNRPWIVACPRGTVVVELLRRIAYNLLVLFRSTTQRSEEKRAVPWKDLLRSVYNALIAATERQLSDLRGRKVIDVTP